MGRRVGRDRELELACAALGRCAHYGSPEELEAARTEVKTQKLRRDIEIALRDAPVLNAEQRQRLARLLTPVEPRRAAS